MTTGVSTIGRRSALLAIAGVLAARGALATPDSTKEWLAGLAKGTPKEGKVTLKAPEIAENGNAVPLTIVVESPMSTEDHVTDVLVVAEANPRPRIATFHFTPLSGAAEANTRIRLAATQNITAVAKMNDGSFFTASKQVKVTIGGCGG